MSLYLSTSIFTLNNYIIRSRFPVEIGSLGFAFINYHVIEYRVRNLIVKYGRGPKNRGQTKPFLHSLTATNWKQGVTCVSHRHTEDRGKHAFSTTVQVKSVTLNRCGIRFNL